MKTSQVTRGRLTCNSVFEFALDRYPTPVLYLLTLPAEAPAASPIAAPEPLVALAQRFGVLERQRAELERQWKELRQAWMAALAAMPDRAVAWEDGRYGLVESEGVEELRWE